MLRPSALAEGWSNGTGLAYLGETDDPAVNVALDTVLLDQAPTIVARIWRNPLSVVVGFNDDPRRSVNLFYCAKNQIPLIRRATGGGAVLHDLGNFNFSMIIPRELLNCDINTRRLYARLSEIPLSALKEVGIPALLSPQNDIIVHGKKVSGVAMRIGGQRLLFHGTLLWKTPLEIIERALIAPIHRGFATHARYISSLSALGFSLSGEDFSRAFFRAIARAFGIYPTISILDGALLATARAIAPRYLLDPAVIDPTLA
ncbi:MAG: lipoate--protein ligase family protein [bacterium JZ-2024 1]